MYLERFIETSISNLYIFKEVHLGYYFSLFDVGFVYNVSPYMEYHPGGEEELMRAAGSDGTDLFDQVRYWTQSFYHSASVLLGSVAGQW